MNRRQFLAAGTCTAVAATVVGPSLLQGALHDEALSRPRITSVETRSFLLPWPRHVGRNAKLDHHGNGPTVHAVILSTDRGATGWAPFAGNVAAAEALRSAVVGKPLNQLFAPDRGILDPALHPFDMALHDLAGVILEMPVWKMLGAERPHQYPVYSGMIYFDDLYPLDRPGGIDAVVANCVADRQRGYRQLKIKIGRGNRWMSPAEGLQRDIDVVRAVAQAVPDCQLLVDGNDGFTAETAIAFLKGIEGIPLVWVEEPFVESDAAWRTLHGWMRSNGWTDTLLADGEQGNNYPVLEKLEADGIVQVRLCDIASFGFTKWRALMPQLAQTRTLASPHAWGNGLKTVYAAHLVGGLGGGVTIEGVPHAPDQSHVDFGDNILRDGQLQLSQAPGFGMKLR